MRTILLVATVCAAGLGCASDLERAAAKARPLPSEEWPFSRWLPYLVAVFQPEGYGNGCIVHSCEAHGTYVLTAFHVADEQKKLGVWVLAGARVPARQVYPEPAYDEGEAFSESELRRALYPLTQDFAVLKLETDDLYPVAPLSSRDEEPPLGTRVELAAIAPEGYPHVHPFEWSWNYPPEVWKAGHSGSPILAEGEVVALIATVFPESGRVMERPTVQKIRTALREAGLGFVLDPACDRVGYSPRRP